MEFKIVKKEENILLKRTKVEAECTFLGQKTPSNAEVTAALAKATGVAEDAIAVRSILTAFGDASAKIEAFVYDSKASLDKFEAKPKKKPVAGAA